MLQQDTEASTCIYTGVKSKSKLTDVLFFKNLYWLFLIINMTFFI